MRKLAVVLMWCLVLLMACNKETPVIAPLGPNRDAPTLAFEFVSIASTVKFVPFGDSLPIGLPNKGYEIVLSDTNESVLTACAGIVTKIQPDTTAAGASIISVKFKPNSIYSFTYGGVSRVRVHVNDTLNAGSILGKVSRSGIVDFQIITNGNMAICPQSFGSPGFNQAMDEAIRLQNTLNPLDTLSGACNKASLPL